MRRILLIMLCHQAHICSPAQMVNLRSHSLRNSFGVKVTVDLQKPNFMNFFSLLII